MNFNSLINTARRWFYDTPDRALDQAYRAALLIRAIEDEHFAGQPVSPKSGNYSQSIVDYFQTEVNKHLKTIKIRLAEFKNCSNIINLPDSKLSAKTSRIYYSDIVDKPTVIIEKLRFIDQVTQNYLSQSKPSVALVPIATDSPRNPSANAGKVARNASLFDIELAMKSPDKSDKTETVSDKTGLLPRSLLRTFSRIRQEIDPKSNEAEEEVVFKFRRSRGKTAISIKFLLLLIIIPLLTQQVTKILITPIVHDHFLKETSPALFVNKDLEEEALGELKRYQESLEMRNLVGIGPHRTEEEIEQEVKRRAGVIVEEYREQSYNALENIFADIFSFFAFILVLIFSQKEIAIMKSFMDEIVYGLSDSAKAFLIILFTDIFVGYHSPHGWEVILESVARHFGIAENREFNFLFIATFPVILDTVLKYWIFRYLNRISPSAVATYRNMNE